MIEIDDNNDIEEEKMNSSIPNDEILENDTLKKIISIQEIEQKKEINDLENKLLNINESIKEIDKDFFFQKNKYEEELFEKEKSIKILEDILNKNNDLNLKEKNLIIFEEISNLENKKNELELNQNQILKEINILQNFIKDQQLQLNNLTHKESILKLLKYFKQIEQETNENINKLENQKNESNKLLNNMIPQLDSLNLDTEDLYEQNLQLYEENENLTNEFEKIKLENQNLYYKIQSKSAMVTLDFINLHIESEEKKSNKKFYNIKKKIEQKILKDQENLLILKQELDDRSNLVEELIKKIEKLNKDRKSVV